MTSEDTAFVAWLETTPTKVATVPMDGGLRFGWCLKDFVASHLNSSWTKFWKWTKDPEICLFCLLLCNFACFFKDQDDIHEKNMSGIKR